MAANLIKSEDWGDANEDFLANWPKKVKAPEPISIMDLKTPKRQRICGMPLIAQLVRFLKFFMIIKLKN